MYMNSNNMIKVDNFNHKKVYVGTPVDFGETIKSPKRCLFVTPYKGIASIFTCDRNLYKQGATPGIDNVNIGYEEWGLGLSELDNPIDTIHVKIEGDPDHKTLKFKTSGYIYEIDASKYKNNIYQYDWMDKEREFLIVGFDEIEFVKKQKHETTRIVKGYPSKNNELKMTCELISDEYNNEVEVYQYQFYDIIKPKEYVWVGSCNIIINDKYDKYKLPESHYISKGIWVDQFYIDDKYRGKGYGSKIMLMLIQKHGINHMACEESNTIALHLYNKMGFNQYDKDGDLIFLKRDNNVYEESKIDDIRNGVNPYSNKLFFHISFDDSLDGKVLKPRIPPYIASTYGKDPEKAQEEMKKGGYIEDITTPRVCFSNSIEGCLNAIMNMDKVLHTAGKEVYVYIPEKPIEEYKHKTNKEIVKEKLVFDAKATQEMWILEDVKLKLYGTIVIDKIYNKTLKNVLDPNKKKSDNKIGYNHFRWHWQCNPKILQESTLSSTERDDLNDSEFGIPNKRKYPLTDKTHVLKAVQFFKFADASDRPELAKRIINKAKEFNMDYSNWNSIKEYLPKEFMKEGFDMNYDRFGNPLNRTLVQEALEPQQNDGDDFDISSFGSDTFSNKSPNNEYDETEVKILNALIADEQHAVGRYFDAAKNSKDKNLSRLYADIGAEERFHAEQLMYSKSMLTGEEYEPFDPEVKKEYEELLAMGMDEESAMTTAIDKRSMLPNYDDEDDSDVDEIQKDVEILEYAIDCHTSMLNTIDMICESDNFTMEQRDHALNVLLESYIIQEAVDNVRPGGNTQNVMSNPVYQLLNGFSSFLKFIRQLCDKFKNFINKNKVKQMRLREFIKTNGIFGIFKPGVSLYFYDPKTPGDLSIAPFQYVELMNNVAVDIMKEHGLTTGLDKINLLSPTISIRYSSATQGLAILNGVVLTKTKIIVDDNNKNAIEELFFGFSKDDRINVNSPDKYDRIMRSGNIYNKLNNLLNWTDLSCKKISKSIQAIQNLQQDTNSIYYTNRNQYNSCIEKLKQVEKCFNKFLKALVSDINTVMKLNNGILEATNAKDDDFNRQMTK